MSPPCTKSLFTLITLVAVSGAIAADDIKQIEGISIVGNKEAPKSLYIVPWHKAERKQNTSLSTNLVDNEMHAVDHDSFIQQLRLYELSRSGWYRLTPNAP